jgi:hypothetical protein
MILISVLTPSAKKKMALRGIEWVILEDFRAESRVAVGFLARRGVLEIGTGIWQGLA